MSERLKEHQTIVHENQEQVLTNEEFENLNENNLKQIKDYGVQETLERSTTYDKSS